jgi:hypothetical protein
MWELSRIFPLFSSVRRLVYTARNVLIRPSSVLSPPLWTQLNLDVDLHVSSVPTLDFFISCSFAVHAWTTIAPNTCFCCCFFFYPMAFRCFVTKQLASFFPGIFLRECSLSNEFVGSHTRFLCILIVTFLQYAASYPVGTEGSLPGIKRPGRESDHSPPTSAEVKKTWIYKSTPPYAFMV